MKIILDSNILFSALIKDSLIRAIIFASPDNLFLLPDYFFEEFKKHKKLILEKSELTEFEFDAVLQQLFLKITIVPNEITKPHYQKAYDIIKTIDPKDTSFIACVLAYNDSVLWSDDKKLKNQKLVSVFNTSEIITLISYEIISNK